MPTQHKKSVATNAMHFQFTPKFTAPLFHIWNPAGGLRWTFFAETASVGCFSRGTPSLMFEGILILRR